MSQEIGQSDFLPQKLSDFLLSTKEERLAALSTFEKDVEEKRLEFYRVRDDLKKLRRLVGKIDQVSGNYIRGSLKNAVLNALFEAYPKMLETRSVINSLAPLGMINVGSIYTTLASLEKKGILIKEGVAIYRMSDGAYEKIKNEAPSADS